MGSHESRVLAKSTSPRVLVLEHVNLSLYDNLVSQVPMFERGIRGVGSTRKCWRNSGKFFICLLIQPNYHILQMRNHEDLHVAQYLLSLVFRGSGDRSIGERPTPEHPKPDY